MTWQSIAPINGAEKLSGISAYTANQPGSRQKKEQGKKQSGDTFSALLANTHEQNEKTERNGENMREAVLIMRPRIHEAQSFVPYLRAKAVSGTLAFELAKITLDYEN